MQWTQRIPPHSVRDEVWWVMDGSQYWVYLALSHRKYSCWVRGCDDSLIIFDGEQFADEIAAAEYAEVLQRLDGYDLD